MINVSPIEAEREKLRSIISNVSEGVVVSDSNQNISIMNKAAEHITSFGVTEAIGKPIGEVIKLIENEKTVSPDVYCPTSTGIDIDNVVYQKKDIQLATKENRVKAIDVTSRKIKGGTEIGVGCILIINDKSTEAELERMKLDFVAMSVHVLRTPLSILKGYLSFLMDDKTMDKLNEKEKEYVGNSATSVNDLINLVENLLDLAEIQRGNFNLEFHAIDLDQAVNVVVQDYKPQAEAKGLKFVYAPAPSTFPLVRGDATRVLMVIKNLIGNAVKFTEEGYIKVGIERTKDGFLEFWVEDTGKGIPKENIELLFNKFYRVKEALEMQMGNGLGLYVSKKIVDEHGGKIWVESQVGKGSKFHFTIPISKSQVN